MARIAGIGRKLGAGLALATALCIAAPAAAQEPRANWDPVIAAAGDIACDPADPAFNGGLGTADRCRQLATSDLLLDQDLAAVLPPAPAGGPGEFDGP